MTHTRNKKLNMLLFLGFFFMSINIYAQDIKQADIDSIIELSNKIRACELLEQEVLNNFFLAQPHVLFQKEELNNIALSFFMSIYTEGLQISSTTCFFAQEQHICRGDLACRFTIQGNNLLKKFSMLSRLEGKFWVKTMGEAGISSVLSTIGYKKNPKKYDIEENAFTKNKERRLECLLDSIIHSKSYLNYEVEFIYIILTSQLQTEEDYTAFDSLLKEILKINPKKDNQNLPASILYSVIFKLKTNYKDESNLNIFLEKINCDKEEKVLLENYAFKLNLFYNEKDKDVLREKFEDNPIRNIIKEISLYKDSNMIKLLEKYASSEKRERKIESRPPLPW